MHPNVITLEQAQSYAQNWNLGKGDFFDNFDFKAVIIPKDIIQEILSFTENEGVRLYMGLDGNYTEMHCMVVGVDKYDEDVINYENGNYIYQFLRPCPPWCRTKAPFINNG